jgi:E3 ubiquitin-protein ligase HUWE1
MVITKREEKFLNEVSKPLKALEENIVNSSEKDLPKLLNDNLQWKTSKGNLLNWVPVLNKFDTILESLTRNYGLTEEFCKPQEISTEDTTIVCAILDFTYMLLDNCVNRAIYATSHRLYDLLNSPTIPIAIRVLQCFVVLGRRFINQRPNSFIGQRKVSERIYSLSVFLPASTLTANTGSSENLSLIDFIKENPQTPKKWKGLEYVFYPNEVLKLQENNIENSPSIRRVRNVQTPSPRKKKGPSSKVVRGEKVETFFIPDHDVRKLTLQQMFDKGIERIPEKLWLKFSYRAIMAKAFNANSYENIKLRQNLVILKALSIAFLVMINRELEVTSRIFEADPTLLSCLIDLINLHNTVPREVRFAAVKCLDSISAKKTWSSEIVRGLGGSVSHGLVFQNLRLMVKQVKESNEKEIFEDYNLTFFNLISNLASNKTLAGSLVSAGLIQHLSEFINVQTKFKITVASAVHLLQTVVTSSSDNVMIFRDNEGFGKLIKSIGSEVDFALTDSMGGPPPLSIVNYSISYGQCNFIRYLLKFVHHIIQKESGDTVRNLFDSALLKDINKILTNVKVFGFTLLTHSFNIVSSIIHNEPTSYPILKEAGTIDIIMDNFSSFLGASSDLVCAIPNIIGAIALNNDGLKKVQESGIIDQFFKIFASHDIAKAIVQNESYDFLAGAIDELSRHYPDFKPIILSNLATLVERLANGQMFELPRPKIYRSPNGAFYHSKDEEIIDNEEECSQLDTWETIEQAYILESAASVIGGLVELGSPWINLSDHIRPHDWMKLIVLKNSPFDYLYSNAMYPVNGALKYLDDNDRNYAIRPMFEIVEKQVNNITDYFECCEARSIFQALEDDIDRADDLFNRMIAANNALFAFVDVFCNSDSLSSARAEQLCKFFGSDKGSELILKLGKLLQRLSFEEHILRTSMPQSVAEETIIKEYDDGFPPTRIFDSDPNEKLKHEKTSAKFKNSCQVRLVGHRLHSSIAIIFNTLLMLSNIPSDDIIIDPTRWMAVKIAEYISGVFVNFLTKDLFEVPDLFLILLYTMHYCFTDSHSDNVLTIPAIIFMQKGGLLKEKDALRHFWSKLKDLDPAKISEIKDLAFVKNSKESIIISIILNCLVFFNKLTDFNGVINVSSSSRFYESDWNGMSTIQVHDLKSILLVQTKLLGFGVLHDLFDNDSFDVDQENNSPDEVIAEVVKLSKNIFSSIEEKHLNDSDGSLFEIQSMRVQNSRHKIEYLMALGMTEASAVRALSSNNGDLSFLDDGVCPVPPILFSWANVLEKFTKSKYETYIPKLAEPQYLDHHTVVELQELRESQRGLMLDHILLLAQVHPQSNRLVADFLISSFLDAPGFAVEDFETTVLRLVLDYIESFELTQGGNKCLASMFQLFSILISNDTVFFACHSSLEEFSSHLITGLRPDFVNSDWFDDALFSLIRIFSGSQLTEPLDVGQTRQLIGVLKEQPASFKLSKDLGDKLFEIAIHVPEITTTGGALTVCRLLTIYAGDPRYADRVSHSGVIEKILKAISYPKLQKGEKPFALQTSFVYLVRRCYETKEIIQDLVTREIKQQYTSKSKKDTKERTRDLSSVLKDSYGVIMRAPDIFVEEISKRVRFVDFSANSMKSFSTKLIEVKDEDTVMHDVENESGRKTESCPPLQSQTGIMHLILTELMSAVKNDWISEPPLTDDDKAAEEKKKEKEKELEVVKPPKSDVSKNEHCSHIIFLLKVLTELLASYKQSKLEFLTFSKKQLFQSSKSEAAKPRSTSLNFLLHQLILAGKPDLPDSEMARKLFISDLAVSTIISFVSTVSNSEIKANPKNVDPDLTFMRKFTIDSIHKVLKESVATAPGLKSMCNRVTSLCLTLRSLLSPNEESYLDSSVIEFDAFHLANVVFESGLPGTLTSILSDVDLNFSDYIFPLEAVVNVLSFLGQIKANHQELFREMHPSTGLEEEEVEEDENDFKEEIPDLFQNSTLGMYDVAEIDSEDGYTNDELSFDEDDDDLDDEDLEQNVEIIYSDDEDIIGSDAGESVSGCSTCSEDHVESDSEDSQSSDGEMDSESDATDEYTSYDIVPGIEMASDFDSEEDSDHSGYSGIEEGEEENDVENFSDEEDDDHDHIFEIDSDGNELIEDYDEDGNTNGHWMVRGRDHSMNRDHIIDFDELAVGDEDDEGEDEDEDEDDDDNLSDDSEAITRALQSGGRSFIDRGRIRHGRAHGSSSNRNFFDVINTPHAGAFNRNRQSSQLNQFYSYFVNFLNERSARGTGISPFSPPSSSRNGVSELKVMSTRDRCIDLAVTLSSKSDSLRLYGYIFKKIYEPSREIHEAKMKEDEMRRKTLEDEAKKCKAEEEERKRLEEESNPANFSVNDEAESQMAPAEPVWVTIGGRQVDISGTDIDPEFFEALPDDMREDVFTQHIRERREQASGNGESTREIDQDFLDALPENIRDEILTQEAISNRLRAAQELIGQTNADEDLENAGNNENDKKEKQRKQKLFFTPLIDRYGVASLMRYIFIPQSFPGRKSLYMLFGQLCLSKQTRSEVLGLMVTILQDGVLSQESLEAVFHQICARAKPVTHAAQHISSNAKPGTPKTPSTPVVPKSIQSQNHFPNRASPFVVACQVLEALQFLLESDTQLRHHFVSEHEPITLLKKPVSAKKQHLTKQSKYPLNTLLALLDIPLVKQKSVLMDGLSRLVQITSRPLEAMKKAQEGAEDGKKIELPNILSSSLKNVVTILVSDDCSSRTFQQTLSAMHNMLVLKAHNIFSNELSKLATKLGDSLNQDLEIMVNELNKNDEDATDFDADIMLKFTSPSSDQSKLLRVLTALDYLFGTAEQKDGEADKKIPVENKELTKLYNNLKLGSLWGALSHALDAFESNKNITHIATALLPLIESLMVVCKHSKVKEVQAKDALKYENQKCDFVNEPIENLFFSFTNEHKKILNQMVRSNPKLMSGPFAMLVKNPRILEFDNKKNYFDRKLHDGETEKRTLAVSVRRKEVFLDSYRALFFKSKDEFRDAKLEINFKGEAGVDAGGVTREWYQVLSRQMFNPDYALFLPVASDKTTFHPNRTSWANPEHLSFFKFVGRVIGKAIYDNCFLDCHFSRDVYKSILGRSVSLKDLETIDLEYYKSLMWMLENDITDIIIETFSVEADDYGEVKTIDLIPNGRNIAVTEENKHDYVRLVVEFRLQKSVTEQVDNFLQGFHEIIPKDLISIFDEQELELLISGLPDIDVDDWKNNTNYVNYTASSQEISYFWRAVRSFDKEERAKLLQFATGTSKVPLNGFKELAGSSGATKFNIHKDFGSTDRLPSSHTCFNQIDLPAYDSYERLRKALLLAINEGHEGFGLA